METAAAATGTTPAVETAAPIIATAAHVTAVVAMNIDTAGACLKVAHPIVEHRAFRIAPRALGVVLIEHETL
jgi:hypothetical protein